MGEKKYTLMHKNVKVIDLLMDSGVVITIDAVYNINHLPIGIEKINDMPVRSSLNQWWQRRSIPVSRSRLKEGLEILGVRNQRHIRLFRLYDNNRLYNSEYRQTL